MPLRRSVRSVRSLVLVVAALLLVVALSVPAPAQAPKSGGVLRIHPLSAPPSLSPHEESTIATVQPASGCYNNLIYFDPAKKQESESSIIPELAERWSWQDGHRNLVFLLRKDVKWHDGQPFTSKDVKYTFDAVRGAPDATAKLRVNPRKLWYENVEHIETPDPHTVVFRLKRPQPSLLLMFASGYSPVYPAHVPFAELKTKCVGTGPFKLKDYRPGEFVEFERNSDYFVKGRPYLDGLKWVIIKDRSTQIAALQAGQLDVAGSGWNKANWETAKKGKPELVTLEAGSNVNTNVLVNFKKPPMTDPRVRQAVNLALDRKAYQVGPQLGASTFGASTVTYAIPRSSRKRRACSTDSGHVMLGLPDPFLWKPTSSSSALSWCSSSHAPKSSGVAKKTGFTAAGPPAPLWPPARPSAPRRPCSRSSSPPSRCRPSARA